MTDDEPDDDGGSRPRRRRSGGGGGGGGLSALFSLLGLMIRWPKTSLVLIVAFVAWVYFSDGVSDGSAPSEQFTTGATLDPKVYDEALVYEPLAASARRPERVSLREFAPRRRNQGQQGSCVGWATSYAARTILHARQTGQPPDDVAFSPSYLFNQIALPGCNGTYLVRAMELLEGGGGLPMEQFAYDASSCEQTPSREEKSKARDYRIAGFTRLSLDADDYRTNADALKENLAQGAPVVIGMRVGGSFKSQMRGRRLWTPTDRDYDGVDGWNGHAMAVIGYDDLYEGGAFELMNSWGDDWGEDGVAWVRYRDFDHFVREAYGLYPMGKAGKDTGEQRIRFGLLTAKGLDRIPMKRVDALVHRSVRPMKKGDRFKVEFSNTQPVYTYLLGEETDGSSYVLFPYTPKHSPYCGTVGTRIFPRKQSLTVDELGTRDSVAVVISPKPLDVAALNARVSSQRSETYAGKLRAALGDSLVRDAQVRVVDGVVELSAPRVDPTKVHALVLEFDKR